MTTTRTTLARLSLGLVLLSGASLAMAQQPEAPAVHKPEAVSYTHLDVYKRQALTAEQKEQNRSLLIILMMLCSIGALLLFDHGVLSKLCPNVVALWKLRHLPEHRIGDNFEGPAILRGTIETTDTERNTPAGNPSVIYYAWVEDHYRSGKSTTVRVICNIGEDEKLVFRQGASTVPFELFHHDEHIALLKKDGWLESLPMQRVAIDLGRVTELTTCLLYTSRCV